MAYAGGHPHIISHANWQVAVLAAITGIFLWIEPAMVRQILEHVGEPASAPAIAPARSPPVEVNGQQLIAPEAVEAIPELEFDQTANLAAEAGHDRLVADADTDAEPNLKLEFDQTLGW